VPVFYPMGPPGGRRGTMRRIAATSWRLLDLRWTGNAHEQESLCVFHARQRPCQERGQDGRTGGHV